MSKKNNVIAAGLNGLLKEAVPQQDAEQAPAKNTRQRKGHKTVCYSIPEQMAEAVKHIAAYENRKINDVVIEALALYLRSWDGSKAQQSRREWINNISDSINID